MGYIELTDEEYKQRIKEDLNLCERALLNYPHKAKKINHLINFLNKKLEGLK